MKNTLKIAVAGAVTIALLTGCAATGDVAAEPQTTESSVATPSAEETTIAEATTQPKAPVVEKGIAKADETETQLVYLIEEEKLAHDVYTKMFELWGARVFGNILQSEETHQSQVLTVMQTRDIEDQRSSKVGVFVNDELQALYNELIAKGSKSAVDAYEVGVAIEELDIDDLTKMLATAKDADVIAMMENLRMGSENHLRAFNNQL
jgi:hypothetical protein